MPNRQEKGKAKAPVKKQMAKSESSEEEESEEDSSEEEEEVQKPKAKPKPKAKAKAKAAAKKAAKQVDSDSEEDSQEDSSDDPDEEEEEVKQPKPKAKAKAKAAAKKAAKQVESDSDEEQDSSPEEQEPKPKPKAKAKAKAAAKKSAAKQVIPNDVQVQGDEGASATPTQSKEGQFISPPPDPATEVSESDRPDPTPVDLVPTESSHTATGEIAPSEAVAQSAEELDQQLRKEVEVNVVEVPSPGLDEWAALAAEFAGHVQRHRRSISSQKDPLLRALNTGMLETGLGLLLRLAEDFEGRGRQLRVAEEASHWASLLLPPDPPPPPSAPESSGPAAATAAVDTGRGDKSAAEGYGEEAFAGPETSFRREPPPPTISARLPAYLRASNPPLARMEAEVEALEALLATAHITVDVPDLATVLAAALGDPAQDMEAANHQSTDAGAGAGEWQPSHQLLREEALQRRDEYARLKERLAGHAAALALSAL